MHRIHRAARRSRPAAVYCSDLAYSIGLLLVWQLLVVLAALWLVPWVLTLAAAPDLARAGARLARTGPSGDHVRPRDAEDQTARQPRACQCSTSSGF
jgi:hypothetical protein